MSQVSKIEEFRYLAIGNTFSMIRYGEEAVCMKIKVFDSPFNATYLSGEFSGQCFRVDPRQKVKRTNLLFLESAEKVEHV